MTSTADADGTCPVCGLGEMIDIAFDADVVDPKQAGTQSTESHQLITYSCGHVALGARLASADGDRLAVEHRTAAETAMPLPGGRR